jgi:two-component system response regulator CpxR
MRGLRTELCACFQRIRLPSPANHHAHLSRECAGKCVLLRDSKKLTLRSGSLAMRPKKVILCVDDNEQDLSVLKFMLKTNGYKVLTATNGDEAIALFGDNAVDLVLSDYAMPKMDGNQLVKRLKLLAAHVPMVLLGDPQKMDGQQHGADALVGKQTCSPQELLERIKIMSARKRGPRKGMLRQAAATATELAVAS